MVALVALLPFSRQLYSLASIPMRAILPTGGLIATDVASPMLAPLRLTLFAAVVVTAPWICFQLWMFVSPALYRRERLVGLALLPVSILLFYGGILFCWMLIFPLLFDFFASFTPEGVTMMTDISRYLDFVLRLSLVFGFAFETPVVLIALAATGAVATATLAHARPYILLGCLTVGMLLTPPDVVSQLLLAVPVWLLYEVALLILRLLRI